MAMNENELQEEFNAKMLEKDKNPNSGIPFSNYLQCFSDGSAPSSARALRNMVGGEYSKARIAYKVITRAMKPAVAIRDKPEWYADVQKTIFKSIEDSMNHAWNDIDQDIQATVKAKTEIMEAKLNQAYSEHEELYEVIDDLESKEKELIDGINRLKSELVKVKSLEGDVSRLDRDNDYLRNEIETLNNILSTKDEELKGYFQSQWECKQLTITVEKSQEEIQALKGQINQLITKIPDENAKDSVVKQAMDISEKVQAELNDLKGSAV